MKPALVLVDLQNDFLHPDYKSKSELVTKFPKLLENIALSVVSFRRRQLPVIWIRSEYEHRTAPLPPRHLTRPKGDKYQNAPLNNDRLAGSHYGSKVICIPDSPGANFHPDIQKLVLPNDVIITKTYYSAFTETSLNQTLQHLNIDTLFFAGVTANTCVRATVIDAFFHGYSLHVIKSAIASFSNNSLDTILSDLQAHYGANTINHRALDEVLFDPTLPTLYYVNGSIPSWRVMLLLSEKHIAYNPRRLLVMSDPKETRLPEFTAINPRGKTPTLVDSDGTIVIESIAILQYLETYYPGSFMPSVKQADKKMYTTCLQRIQESENLHNVCEGLEYLFLSDSSLYQREILESLEGTMSELVFWETYTRNSVYVAAETFTIADCALWPVLGYLIHRGLELEGHEWRGLRAYADRMNGSKENKRRNRRAGKGQEGYHCFRRPSYWRVEQVRSSLSVVSQFQSKGYQGRNKSWQAGMGGEIFARLCDLHGRPC
ncbi:Isochorismatase-like protein [Rhodocollybia butyracea]|uniref:Isochorismatase-like protein n=1 Tax=Rhodocollybia butyracea TaxID=206335 RepID=A0A9P5Q8Y9_9AGAR|nr:Isochorismatase-like protein [Rhodocollybia butyracea]